MSLALGPLLLLAAVPARADDDDVDLEVEVTAPRADGTDPASTSAAVTVLEVDDTLGASADVASVVDSTSGTVVRRLGGLGDYATVSIRGSSARQVLVSLDGVPLNPDGSQAVDLSELPLSAFSRVEVFRGSAPAELTAAPIGGAVNLVTGDVPTMGTVARGTHGTSRVSGSTGVAGPVSLLSHGQPAVWEDSVLVLADLFTTQGDFRAWSDNGTRYDDSDDAWLTRDNNDKRQLSALARWRLRGRGVEISLSDSFLAREEGLPGPISTPASAPRLATVRSLASGRVEGHWGGAWRGSALAWHQHRDEMMDDPEGELGVGGAQRERYLTRTVGLTGHLSWGVRAWLVTSLTLTARQDGFVQEDLLAGERADPRRRRVAAGTLGGSLRALDDRLLVEPALQATWLDDRSMGTDEADQELVPTPRVGVLLRPRGRADAAVPWSGLALKANAGRSFRPPDLTELFGDRGSVVGNTALVPERGWQADVGVRWDLPPGGPVAGSADVAHFWSDVQHQIVYVQNSQHTAVPVNLGQGWTQGLEVALGLDVLGWVDSQSNLTWTVSRNLTPRSDVADRQLPRVPTWELYQGTSVHWGEHVRLGHTWSYTSGTYQDETNWFLSPPRSLHGAFLRVGLGPLSAEVSVLNLLDRTTDQVDRNPLSDADDTLVTEPLTDFFGYPLPGRTLLITLAWSGRPTAPERP